MKNLVKVFYSNATTFYADNEREESYNHTHSLVTWVMWKRIIINAITINDILNIMDDGRCSYSLCKFVNETQIDRELFVFPPPMELGETNANRLSLHDRILHLIISWNIKPSGEKYSQV